MIDKHNNFDKQHGFRCESGKIEGDLLAIIVASRRSQ